MSELLQLQKDDLEITYTKEPEPKIHLKQELSGIIIGTFINENKCSFYFSITEPEKSKVTMEMLSNASGVSRLTVMFNYWNLRELMDNKK